ncbi:MAG: XRE family transcriptional regulator [Marinilabilia sp.]
MEEQLKQIAARVREMREILDMSPEAAAKACGITSEKYSQLESGQIDIPVSVLHKLAKAFDIEVTTLLSGEEPRMHAYTLTRKGQGIAMERRQAYKYQALATNFINRKADPFIVTVEPKPDEEEVDFNTHPGHEFNLVMKGTLHLFLNNKKMVLNEGDSIYFDSSLPHGMKAANGQKCEFLAVIL